jgi:hypothetical protein
MLSRNIGCSEVETSIFHGNLKNERPQEKKTVEKIVNLKK